MRHTSFLVALAATLLLLGAVAGAEKTAQYPAYMRAQAKLRDARAQLSLPPQASKQDLPPHAGDPAQAAESPPASDEQRAIEEIDQALQDVKDASEDDGKGFDDHAAVDTIRSRRERLRLAIEMLNQAHDDIEQRQQGSYLKGLKANSAQEHIERAKRAIHRAIEATQN